MEGRLDYDCAFSVFSHLNAVDLDNVRRTCKFLRHTGHEYLRHRVLAAISPYVGNARRFLLRMENVDGVISGSVALNLLFPQTATQFTSKDLDVYVPASAEYALDAFLRNAGYKEVGMNMGTSYDIPSGAIGTVHSYINTIKKRLVDVVVAKGEDARVPVLYFHSTPVMNYVTATALFSAYPHMTLARQGLFNPHTRRRNGLPTCRTYDAIIKYWRRGFDITLNDGGWLKMGRRRWPHLCLTDFECPQFPRQITDNGCLVIEWEEHELRKQKQKKLAWKLGGIHCLRPNVTEHGYIENEETESL
ncbi:hypothetical protein CONPUDRAFT_155405 [Coniophora puteana RWD-64-598 SS2]|uniref:F-box domain-containing protein n=1 Tax=Coniophora puteana (strain RWD-64-598) TaxID=741705 RepID=A0A5M3MLZ6_CONPW|nr:uncharacterized protein CONPUDRAFT_155405 [Coniophora puteana RWD-64-598 SS2]EIW80030.1 hypothetical protein CONPUDRAFT_155405 [Coniophora puteana RWD-64-598 SS2]